MRTQSSYLVADCGRIAPDDLPAHGHGDVLSFEWSVKGHRIIVDQGVYEYIAGPRRRQSQTAMSHNTLCLEDADQAELYSSFRCGRRPNVDVRNYNAHAAGFVLEGTHDGFAHLPGRRSASSMASSRTVNDDLTRRRGRVLPPHVDSHCTSCIFSCLFSCT
jgi:uncharacterized heparinase superfamily protein